MKPGTSFLLDGLRLGSALGVFVSHCLLSWFSAFQPTRHLHIAAHACVIVFFVLSGYLIAYTTLGRHRTGPQYCAARLARLYSVALPALALTALLWLIGRMLEPLHYANFERGYEFIRLGLTALFLNECWFISAAPPSNMPFWSLSYEFWYYVLFGAALFVRRPFWRWAAPLAVAVLCGPKVLLLFPVWLAGAAAFFATTKITLKRAHAALAIAALVAVCALVLPHIPMPLENFGYPPLFYSGLFVSDWALGVVLATAIFLADQAVGNMRIPAALSRPVKAGAGVTFSIYLLHFPLLIFASAVFPYDKSDAGSVVALGGGVLLTAILFGYWFERRETLKALSDRFEAAFTATGFRARLRAALFR